MSRAERRRAQRAVTRVVAVQVKPTNRKAIRAALRKAGIQRGFRTWGGSAR